MSQQEYINEIIQNKFATNVCPPDQEMVEAKHPTVDYGMTKAFIANNVNTNPPISPLPVLAPATVHPNLNHASIMPSQRVCFILHRASLLFQSSM